MGAVYPEIWKTQGMNNHEQAREELILLNVIREALDRRDEVFQIIDEAPDESAAIARLGQLLNVEDHLCRAILNLQVQNWLGTWRERVDDGVSSLRADLERDEPRA